MAFVTLGSGDNLIIKVPTIGTTDWADTMRTDTFLLIATHDHTGSGSGDKINTGGLAADAVTGAKIRLDNNEYIRARNAADSANINTIKINASDQLALGADLANLAMISDTYLTGRNNADSAYINMLKVDTSDKIAVGADLANLAIVNNVNIQARNNADSGYISIAKVNTSDKIEVGATIVSASVETLATSLIDTLATAVVLADNQAAITTAIITLGSGESCSVFYRLVRTGFATQSGVLKFNDTDTIPSETYTGPDNGITFTVSSAALFYASTSTGNTTSMTYTIIKE